MRQMHALKMNLGRRPRNEYAGEGKRGVSREWDIISRRDAEMRRNFSGLTGSRKSRANNEKGFTSFVRDRLVLHSCRHHVALLM